MPAVKSISVPDPQLELAMVELSVPYPDLLLLRIAVS